MLVTACPTRHQLLRIRAHADSFSCVDQTVRACCAGDRSGDPVASLVAATSVATTMRWHGCSLLCAAQLKPCSQLRHCACSLQGCSHDGQNMRQGLAEQEAACYLYMEPTNLRNCTVAEGMSTSPPPALPCGRLRLYGRTSQAVRSDCSASCQPSDAAY